MKGKIQKIFGREVIEQKAIDQLEICLSEEGSIGVLSADAHAGYSLCVGGTVAYLNHISPSGVGYDIACGNLAVKTDIKFDNIRNDMKTIMNDVVNAISFGVGRKNGTKVDDPIIERIAKSEFAPQQTLAKLAAEQLGTVGSGNHYVDIFTDDEGSIWIGCHFGSRGFGHKTASGFLALDQGEDFFGKHKEKSEPTLFSLDSQIGQDYLYAMNLAGDYAYAGRNWVVKKVRELLGAKSLFEVHNHHNFAWMEKHNNTTYCVIRKGATPANPGQYGFIGANMMDTSVIVRGLESQESRDGLYTTVHGAGRVMSRTQAAGKMKWLRDEVTGKKRPTRVTKGLVDFDKTMAEMAKKKIELRGAGADEAPDCYKKLNEILEYHHGTIEVLHNLYPIGVAMAGAGEFDPYKD